MLVGLDEAATLWGTTTADDVATLVQGPRFVVVKDADLEAVEIDRSRGAVVRTVVPARRTRVVEAVGAGDAFAGGYLAAWLRGEDATGRLRLGHSLAAWTLGTVGDHRPGHGHGARPTQDEEEDRR